MPHPEDYQERWQRWTDAQAYSASDGLGELIESFHESRRLRKERHRLEVERFWSRAHPKRDAFLLLVAGMILAVIAYQ